ncbi:hypothetical protein NDU88_001096 [Pleurodeles waltl]|uniref:Uncharacterized protein n=1 Tax=Pleurodeles waltl TaxID=8319 RepID=A0AAV7VVH1_PLEWA|nr:hypothetical protein NDU88_001096 [Pleurodeles waltl]
MRMCRFTTTAPAPVIREPLQPGVCTKRLLQNTAQTQERGYTDVILHIQIRYPWVTYCRLAVRQGHCLRMTKLYDPAQCKRY